MTQDNNELILQLLKDKASVKQDVFHLAKERFTEFKGVLNDLTANLASQASSIDNRLIIGFSDGGEFEGTVNLASDVLVFQMHTNVFQFDMDNPLWKSSYLREDPTRGYCGIINVFNFLADSYRYNRINDVGYLVARIFVNKENHFMVQGKRQLGFLYNDFINSNLTPEKMQAIAQSIFLYCIDFDLFMPPYDLVKEVSVMEMKEISDTVKIKTGKRLGFRFQADTDEF